MQLGTTDHIWRLSGSSAGSSGGTSTGGIDKQIMQIGPNGSSIDGNHGSSLSGIDKQIMQVGPNGSSIDGDDGSSVHGNGASSAASFTRNFQIMRQYQSSVGSQSNISV